MKEYNILVINEVEKIYSQNINRLVLVATEIAGQYSIIDKETHSFKLIDNNDVAELLIIRLLENEVEIFNNLDEMEKKYPKQNQKPLFWPENMPWPPTSNIH